MSSQRMSLRVGIVGLSPLTRAVARRLAEGGAAVVAYDPDRTASRILTACGVAAARLPADAAENADVVILDAPDELRSEEWLFDFGGIGETLPGGARVLDLSSTGIPHGAVATCKLRQLGLLRVEAALLGSPAVARAGGLRVLLGGSEQDAAALAPVLSELADEVEVVGPVGSLATLRLVTARLKEAREAALSSALSYAAALGAPLDAAARAADVLAALDSSVPQLPAGAEVITLPRRRPHRVPAQSGPAQSGPAQSGPAHPPLRLAREGAGQA